MTKNTISLSLAAQTKMALHAAKHGFSNPIHGIVLGKKVDSGNGQEVVVVVADVVPVCHEVPTKPIVDLALRLTDAYLSQSSSLGLNIIGWYTANANGEDSEDELPNAPACRIVSSMAENSAVSENDHEGNNSEDFFLLLVSTTKLVSVLEKSSDDASLPVCTVFEKDKSRTFTQRVDSERIASSGNSKSDDSGVDVLCKAMEEQLSSSDYGDADAAAGGGSSKSSSGVVICDFVDHLNDGGRGDWIENGAVNKFVSDSLR